LLTIRAPESAKFRGAPGSPGTPGTPARASSATSAERAARAPHRHSIRTLGNSRCPDRNRGRAAFALLALTISTALAAGEQPLRLTGPQPGEPSVLAREFHARQAAALGLAPGDLEHRISDVVPTRHNGLTHVYLQQTIDGIPVDGAVTTVNVLPDGEILNIADTFVAGARARTSAAEPALSPQVAISLAASYLNVRLSRPPMPLGGEGGPQRHALFDGGALSAAPVPAALLYVRVGDELRLAWNLIVDRFDAETFHAEMRIDALTGDLIDIASYVAHVAGDRHAARPRAARRPTTAPATAWCRCRSRARRIRAPPSPRSSTRMIPSLAARLARHPRDRHPRVRVRRDARQQRGGARRPACQQLAPSNFRAPAQVVGSTWCSTRPSIRGPAHRMAATSRPWATCRRRWSTCSTGTTSCTTCSGSYGFDEPAGNFQVNNYGRGGSGNDAVNADALDGADLTPPNVNNANFSTPADGGAPRMQMFRWNAPIVAPVVIDAPISVSYEARAGTFGQVLVAPLPGTFALVDAGGANGIEGCTALVNAAQVAGKIAVVRRGNCEFGTKALIAQQAGATAVVIYNNIGGTALLSPPPGAQGGSVTIPVRFIGQNDGNALATLIGAGTVTGSLTPPAPSDVDRDSDFDAGIIAHEYAHGLSNRLTGGPSQAACLSNEEQGGEGWSDYVGLMVTMNGNDCAAPRGMGTYSAFQPVTGPGIRRFPYATDRAANPFTFRDVADTLQSVPHGVGSVWATMLWEMTCGLIDEHGFDSNLVTGTGGNNIAMQLVVDGMKLQPCRPSFVQARDAILAADVANNAGREPLPDLARVRQPRPRAHRVQRQQHQPQRPGRGLHHAHRLRRPPGQPCRQRLRAARAGQPAGRGGRWHAELPGRAARAGDAAVDPGLRWHAQRQHLHHGADRGRLHGDRGIRRAAVGGLRERFRKRQLSEGRAGLPARRVRTPNARPAGRIMGRSQRPA
jgi:extracellular elastinolytic metalloproteinase